MIVPYTKVYSRVPMGELTIQKIPIIKIELPDFDYNCLIDSGANYSHMHGDFGREMGLKIESGIPFPSKGIDGYAFQSYLHIINFDIGGGLHHCRVEVAFSDKFIFPQGLLGRKDFFDLFKVHFYQKDGFFELEPS